VDWNKIAWIAMAWVFAWSLTRQLTPLSRSCWSRSDRRSGICDRARRSNPWLHGSSGR
jgi:hypothetical protein